MEWFPLSLPIFPKRTFFHQRLHILLYSRAFLHQEVPDSPPQSGMADPMCGVGWLRQISALDLVPALRPSLHSLQPVLDRPVDRSIIAKLEVEERKIPAAAPVAAI